MEGNQSGKSMLTDYSKAITELQMNVTAIVNALTEVPPQKPTPVHFLEIYNGEPCYFLVDAKKIDRVLN